MVNIGKIQNAMVGEVGERKAAWKTAESRSEEGI